MITFKVIRTRIFDALNRSIYGTFRAFWVPPAICFIWGLFTSINSWQSRYQNEPLLEFILKSFIACFAMAGTGFLGGMFGLILIGIPVLFLLSLVKADHPVIIFILGIMYLYWRLNTEPVFRHEDTILILGISVVTALIAAMYARSYSHAKNE